MFNKTISENVYKYIELNKLDKLASLIRGKDLTAISLVSVVDVLVNQYNYPIEVLKEQGAIVDVEELLQSANSYLQEIHTNPGLKGALKSVKQGLEQLIHFWKKGSLLNEAAEQFLNSQAIHLMQTSTLHGANEVDDYVTENIKTQMGSIYSQWLANANSEQDVMKQINEVVQGRIYTGWKNDKGFDKEIQQKLTKNVNTLLSTDYKLGQLPIEMTNTIESAVIKKLFGFINNKTLGQYPQLETHIASTVDILSDGSMHLDMKPIYIKGFKEIMLDCRTGALGGEIPLIIKQFVIEVIQAANFTVDQVTTYEKKAAQEIITEFKQNVEDVPEALRPFIETTVLDYLEKKYLDDKEFGASIKNLVINMLLVEWKEMESPELRKAVESIVMQDCNALIQEIDKSISSAVLASKIMVLEEKNDLQKKTIDQLITALSNYGITIEASPESSTIVDSIKPTPRWTSTAVIGLFGSRDSQVAGQDEITPQTENSPR
ncbi:MAG: hypothetical protein H0U73_04770 [Tatlockia sp.]|nr:hypothetical protein [Tatlockia sp.]